MRNLLSLDDLVIWHRFIMSFRDGLTFRWIGINNFGGGTLGLSSKIVHLSSWWMEPMTQVGYFAELLAEAMELGHFRKVCWEAWK